MTGGDHERDGFDRDGFARRPAFAGPEVGRRMLDDVVALVRDAAGSPFGDGGALLLPEANLAGRTAAGDDAGADAAVPPEATMSKVFRLHRRPAFTSFLRTDAVRDIVVERIGPDVDCFLSQFIFKNPGAWGQPWHQDSWYFPFEPARPVLGLWLAVTEATRENGCLHVLPGSHTEPVHEHVPDRRPGANYGYVEIVDHDMAASVPVLMDPGDLLVFDSHLMHRSTDNASTGIRAAMVFHVAAAGTRDLTQERTGHPSPVNDWMPLLRDGRSVVGSAP